NRRGGAARGRRARPGRRDARDGAHRPRLARGVRSARADSLQRLRLRADAEPRHAPAPGARPALEPGAADRRPARPGLAGADRAGAALLVPLAPHLTADAGCASSLHYAGTFPILPEGGPLTCDRDGRLRATRAVYLADGSIFPWIPPKGLTFNLMANADRVGTLLARRRA